MLHTHPAWVSSVLLTCPRPKPAIPLSSSTGPSHPLRAVPRIGEGKLLVWGQNSCYIVLFLFRPMRMSYSAITDPCLSEEVVNSVDKVINFYKKQVHHFTRIFLDGCNIVKHIFPRRSRFPYVQSGVRENTILRRSDLLSCRSSHKTKTSSFGGSILIQFCHWPQKSVQHHSPKGTSRPNFLRVYLLQVAGVRRGGRSSPSRPRPSSSSSRQQPAAALTLSSNHPPPISSNLPPPISSNLVSSSTVLLLLQHTSHLSS